MTAGDNDIAMLWACIWACIVLIPVGVVAVVVMEVITRRGKW